MILLFIEYSPPIYRIYSVYVRKIEISGLYSTYINLFIFQGGNSYERCKSGL